MAMEQHWIKTVGAARFPLGDEWLLGDRDSDDKLHRPRLAERVHFPRNGRPRGIARGDRFLLYGVTELGGRLIAAGRFDSSGGELDDGSTEPERDPDDVARWPWRIDVTLLLAVWHAHAAPGLEAIGLPGTKLRRRSHIRIDESMYLAGVSAIAATATS